MVDFLSIANILNFCKPNKSNVRKWHCKKKSSSEEDEVEADHHHQDHTFKPNKQIHQGEVGHEKQENEVMNGVHRSLRYSSRGFQCDDPTTPTSKDDDDVDHHHHQVHHKHKGDHHLHKHGKAENSFSSRYSLSRTFSHSRNSTSSTSPFASKSRKSTSSATTSKSRRSTSSATTTGSASEQLSSLSSFTPSSLSKSSSTRTRSTTPIMFSNSSGMLKPPAIMKQLECSLEDLCYGCEKKIKITRDVIKREGRIDQEEELLTIQVKPGWKKGTKITFEGKGNEKPGSYPADITFVIAEKRHPVYRREGDDLELGVKIPLVEALTGCGLSIPLLGGDKMSFKVDDIIVPGYEKLIPDQGMPIAKEAGKRGHLKVTFLVEFPKQLSDEQRSDIIRILHDSD